MSVPLVIYHHPCADGFTAAWVCKIKHPDWEFIGVSHGDEPPLVDGREVYMLDFSFKRPVLEKMAGSAKSITILDHHITAKDDLTPLLAWDSPFQNVTGVFDMDKSGARLSWEFFHKGEDVPMLVRVVEDRDLWKFEIPESRAISSNIFSYDYNFENWQTINFELTHSPETFERFVAEGVAIDRKHFKDLNELIQKSRFRVMIAGTEVWCANLPYTMSSDACHIMCYDDKTFSACYQSTPEGLNFSLRSKPDGANVSEIAKKYGGGGHKHASGFRISVPIPVPAPDPATAYETGIKGITSQFGITD